MPSIRIYRRDRRKSIFIYILLILLSSCSRFNDQLYSGNTYLNTDSYYLNDSINYSVKLAGDHIQNKSKSNLKYKLKTYDNKPFKGNVLELFETIVEPNFDLFLFYFNNNEQLNSFFSYNKFETVNYSKDQNEIEIIDSIDYVYGTAKMNKDSAYVLLLGYSKEQNRSDYQLMVNEYSELLKTNKFGTNYREILPHPFTEGYRLSNNFDSSFNYLRPIVQLNKHAEMYGEENFQFIQAICTYSSWVSNSSIFNNYFDKYNRLKLHLEIPNEQYLAKNKAAINEIVKRSSTANLVMFNENHFNIKHRELVRLLLKDYYDLGFRYLGLEALGESPDSLIERGYPTIKSGFYTREPEMGNLIREALKVGFYVFGYDSIQGDRELNQAKNIYNNTFKKDSLAKVLVLGGFDHIMEQKDNDSKKWMAYYFHELYAIDPVTFAQTVLISNDSLWLGLIKNDSVTSKSFDYLISNTISDSVFIDQKNKEFTIDLPESKYSYDYIVSIYLKNEFSTEKDCIPVKNLIVSNPTTKIQANLKKGAYIYTVKDNRGILISKGDFVNK